ncbi:B-box zinc finger protein [Acidipila sp. EB88]|uniref:B-box zinc finger protein n=1 Tax=Acidipila sp. EB88 TaxID=2305226 RepID=UPI000F601726|nr:B-box zinc finger protein [Acidipila sp. EB88]RRA48687.1 hypothetical protein D1Y84_10745 [Acidipila sp. EB88]
MNCANHPERTATAFCQNCGKPLCSECTRHAGNLILCEPCLEARNAAAGQTAATPSSAQGWTPIPPSAAPRYAAQPGAPMPPYASGRPKPVVAALLGFIPGVGAMYNGQFVKALLHVVIFIVLIGATEHFDLIGILIPAWIFYQVFDAAQTAAARRDGRPLPDPFGILDMSQRLGPQGFHGAPGGYRGPMAGGYRPSTAPPTRPLAADEDPSAPRTASSDPYANVSGQAAQGGFSQAAWTAPGAAPPGAAYDRPAGWNVPPVSAPASQPFEPTFGAQSRTPMPTPYGEPAPPARRGEPIGAIVLIIVGLLFLLSTLGVLQVEWITRGWPVLLLLLGVWLLIRRAKTPALHHPASPPMPPAPHTTTSLTRSSLSIAPEPLRGTDQSSDQRTGNNGGEEDAR